MIGRKFLKAFGWFWIWELVNYAVAVFLKIFLGSFFRVIITTVVFTGILFSIIYSRRSSKYESKKKYLEENSPEEATVRSVFLSALRSPEYIPEIIGTAPVMLITGIYWGYWLLAPGFNGGEKALIMLCVLIFGTIGFAFLDLLNRFLVYRSWINGYLDTVGKK